MADEMRRLVDEKKRLIKENVVTPATIQKTSSQTEESVELDQKKVEKLTPVQTQFIESFNEALATKNLVLLKVGLSRGFSLNRNFLEKLVNTKC